MSSKLPRIVAAASLWLVLLTLSVPPVMADPNDLFAPVFVNRPQGTLYFSHCDTARYTFQAVSAATGLPSPFVRYRIVTGPGSIDSITGEWRRMPTNVLDSMGQFEVEVAAREFSLETEGLQNCKLQLKHNNSPIQIYIYNQSTLIRAKPFDTTKLRLEMWDADNCDTRSLRITSISPEISGVAFLENEGQYLFLKICPAAQDSSKLVVITLEASDGLEAHSFTIKVQVLPIAHYLLRIGSVEKKKQGTSVDIPVLLERAMPGKGMYQFSLELAFDNSALLFQRAFTDSSDLYNQCRWEYFSYRLGGDGYCQGDCPSGILRVAGMATYSPNGGQGACQGGNIPELPTEVFRIQFVISDKPEYNCTFQPIRFFFDNCLDNAIRSANDSNLYLQDSIFDRQGASGPYFSITTPSPKLPGYNGIPNTCTNSSQYPIVQRGLLLYNGGIEVVCGDTTDSPTDVNEDNSTLPLDFALHQNYPNPFNPSTTISFDLPHSAEVNIEIINVLGQVVWSRQELMSAGTRTLNWDGVGTDGSPVSSGVYYYRLRAADFVQTKKMILMK